MKIIRDGQIRGYYTPFTLTVLTKLYSRVSEYWRTDSCYLRRIPKNNAINRQFDSQTFGHFRYLPVSRA